MVPKPLAGKRKTALTRNLRKNKKIQRKKAKKTAAKTKSKSKTKRKPINKTKQMPSGNSMNRSSLRKKALGAALAAALGTGGLGAEMLFKPSHGDKATTIQIVREKTRKFKRIVRGQKKPAKVKMLLLAHHGTNANHVEEEIKRAKKEGRPIELLILEGIIHPGSSANQMNKKWAHTQYEKCKKFVRDYFLHPLNENFRHQLSEKTVREVAYELIKQRLSSIYFRRFSVEKIQQILEKEKFHTTKARLSKVMTSALWTVQIPRKSDYFQQILVVLAEHERIKLDFSEKLTEKESKNSKTLKKHFLMQFKEPTKN